MSGNPAPLSAALAAEMCTHMEDGSCFACRMNVERLLPLITAALADAWEAGTVAGYVACSAELGISDPVNPYRQDVS